MMALTGTCPIEVGFTEAGEWLLDERLKSGIRFRLTKLEEARVVYAFLLAGEIQHVGVCDASTTTLSDRMGRYRSMQGAGQNRKIAGRIREALSAGGRVSIWAFAPSDDILWHGVAVDLVKGIDLPLIHRWDPPWNKQR